MAVISWNNWVDNSTASSFSNAQTTSPVSGFNILPVDNLKNRQVTDIYRYKFTSAVVTNLQIGFDLGTAKPTNLVCVLNHNLSGLDYAVLFGTASGANDIGTETGTFWSGGTTHDTNSDMLYFDTTYTARYVTIRVTITDTSPWVDRLIDIGRVWIDEAWDTNVSIDFSLGTIDRSTKTKSRGGSTYASTRQILRTLDIKAMGRSSADFVGDVSDSDLKSFMTMDLAVGTHGEVVCLPLTDSQLNKQRFGVYGTISNNNPIRVIDKGANGFLTEKRFTIEEDRG